jgi:hypothetical protein
MKPAKHLIKNEKGFATVESVPLLIVFLVLSGFMFGFFGIIHSAILQSIHSRTYAYEVIRHRTNIVYHRDSQSDTSHYANHGNRLFSVIAENSPSGSRFPAAERPITMGLDFGSDDGTRTERNHREEVLNRIPANARHEIEVNPAWIMVSYGICLNSSCGDR